MREGLHACSSFCTAAKVWLPDVQKPTGLIDNANFPGSNFMGLDQARTGECGGSSGDAQHVDQKHAFICIELHRQRKVNEHLR